MTTMLRAGGAAAMQGARRTRSGAVPPSGSISGTVQHGAVLTLTGSNYTSLQWLHNGSPISGETATTYTVDRADAVLDHGDITCEMTGPGGTVESNALVYEGADLPLAIFCFDYDVTIVSGGFDVISSAFGAIACTLTAASATQRPAASSGGIGGRGLATLDGVDDVMSGTITVGHSRNAEMGIGGGRTATSATGDTILAYIDAGTGRWAITDRTASIIRWGVQSGANQDYTTDPDGIFRHWSGWSTGGQQAALIDGTPIAGTPAAATTTARADGKTFQFGHATTCAQFYAQFLYDGDPLTTDQRTDLRTLLTGLSGHAC